jgi:DNA-binding beta-propeller fold protein YncE
VVGPTGLAFDPLRNLLYVASTGDNTIFAITNPLFTNKDNGTGKVIYQDSTHLHGPLGLVLAPNGHLITANGDAVNPGPAGSQNLLVEFTPAGQFVSQFQVDPGPGGGAFGLAIGFGFEGFRFAAVDDDANTLEIFQLPLIF